MSWRNVMVGYLACAELPEHSNHSLHEPFHSLILEKSASSTSCHYCDKPFKDDYAYTCSQCAFYMHISCFLIPLPTIKCDGEDVQYICHEDPMTLVEHGDEENVRKKCFACQLPWSSPAYPCKTCENYLHKSCAQLPRTIRHPSHSQHSLTLQVSKPTSCDLCFKKDCRLIFSCHGNGCDFELDTKCAFLQPNLKCRSHNHLLSLVENAACDNIRCNACQKSYEEWFNQVRLPNEVHFSHSFFRCIDCDFNLHFLCGPLPSTIKYSYHIHRLALVDSLIEEDFGEYYCDACEEGRNPQFRVYNCADCKYIVHAHCLISEIMKVLKEDTKGVKLRALGESRWDEFGTEIESEEEPEGLNSNLSNNEKAGVDVKEFLTMRDIMDKLNESEKKKLSQPFSSSNYITALFSMFREESLRLFDHKGCTEDISRGIHDFFSFDGWSLIGFVWELENFTAAEGLKLDEVYLGTKIEDVSGYMVPRPLAPILRTLIHKYGNLGGRPDLTQEMKSVASTLLCTVIEKMGRTKVEDITKDSIQAWCFQIQGISIVAGFGLGWLQNALKELIRPFIGCEAIRFKTDAAKKLHRRMAELRAELERCERNCEKIEAFDSSTSDVLRECMSLGSKLKWKYACHNLF
ncbi:Protein kinase C-like phorbol ester/diacylglycerol-binding domain containing protein [Trema orientale]|uniref:Protein kinase C-like phorbol ester/diacylglycerol-binding domain containing protein n=1 Tax=Trema orientale TaxID=63057 RepID=A0A2P5EL51_TREOI|nr:Protein kinase C-like phorbol ester/diacylglycerol-binding domain containing protein [Trema orientale]